MSGISLDKSSLELVEDEEASLIATIAPSDASNKTFTWSSSNTQIATVDDGGKVKAIAPGTATITATTADGGKTATCAVSVEAKPIPVSKGAYKHVIIIGVDGGGAFFKNTSTPRMDAIFKNGAVSYRTKTSYPTISAQCWGSMLHSVLPEFHRLTNGTVGSKPFKPDSPFPSIFRLVKEAFPNANMASFCNWNPINIGIIEDNLGVVKGTGNDPEVADKVVQYIQGNDPTLIFVQFDSVDGAGPNSFSVALLIKTNGVPSDPCIISNKNWNSGGNIGFVLSIRSDEDIKFNAGNNGDRMDAGAGLPLDYKNGWMHVILVVDRDKNKIRLFYDFASELDYDIPESLRNVSFDALDLNIGQDGTGHYGAHLAAQLDEFIITADAFSDEDIAKLKDYYVK